MRVSRTFPTALALAALVLCWLAGGLGPAAAAARTALVIANAAYPDSEASLPTPLGDGQALAEALRERGFAVQVVENASKDALQGAVERFLRTVDPDSIALVAFSGYGIQVGRKNYLVPVDARIWSEADVMRDAVALDGILAEMARRHAGARVVVLDASRRNPFERRFRSFSMGLAPVEAGPGVLSLSAAAPGGLVSDGSTGPSPFGAELAQQIRADGQSAEQTFAAVRDALAKRSRNRQVPALASSLESAFAFDPNRRAVAAAQPPAKEPPAKEPVPEPPPPATTWIEPVRPTPSPVRPEPKPEPKPEPPTQVSTRQETDPGDAARTAETAFARARTAGTRQAFEAFLRDHPAGPLAEQARAEIRRLAEAERPPEPPQAPAAPSEPPKGYSAAETERKAALDAQIARNPGDEAALYARGQFHAQRGETGAAIADFDRAIDLNPANPEALNNRCWLRAIGNDLRKALEDCNAALRLRPNYVDALDSRGLVHLKSGALQAAIADYSQALRADPAHSSALYGRGVARARLGEKAAASKDMAGALALNPAIDREFAEYGLR